MSNTPDFYLMICLLALILTEGLSSIVKTIYDNKKVRTDGNISSDKKSVD